MERNQASSIRSLHSSNSEMDSTSIDGKEVVRFDAAGQQQPQISREPERSAGRNRFSVFAPQGQDQGSRSQP